MIVLGIVITVLGAFFLGQMSRNKVINELKNNNSSLTIHKFALEKEVDRLIEEAVKWQMSCKKYGAALESGESLIAAQKQLIDALYKQVDVYGATDEKQKKVIQEVAVVFEQMKKHHLEDGKYIDSLQREALYWRNLAIEAGKFIRANHPDIEEAYQKAKLQVN